MSSSQPHRKLKTRIAQLENTNRQLRTRLEQQDTYQAVSPAISQLVTVWRYGQWLADPRRSSAYDITTSGQIDWIAHRGDTTREGQATFVSRRQLDRMEREIRLLAKRWLVELSGGAGPKPPAPRCHRRRCAAYGRRQRPDAKYCYSCGGELGAAKGTDDE